VEGDVPVDSETLLTIDFVNLKIKSTQSFTCAHMARMCVHIFIGVIAHRGSMRVYVNLKIKSTQFFSAHMDRICVHVFIGVSARTYINIYMYISKKIRANHKQSFFVLILHPPILGKGTNLFRGPCDLKAENTNQKTRARPLRPARPTRPELD
jgi:hypothetical protein